MRLVLGLAAISGCSFEHGALPAPDAEVDAPPAPATSCRDVTGSSRVSPIEIAGVPVDVFCDLETDDGGWTLVATLVNGDGARNWSTVESFQQGGPLFGTLGNRDAADYKSPAYGALRGNDLLVVTDEYAFSFHALLGDQTFAAFVTSSWPASCSGTWLREGASFTSGLTPDQARLLGLNLRARDPNDNACFPVEESAAIAFMAGDVQNNGLGNAPLQFAGWGALDLSLPNLAAFTPVECAPPTYPCNLAGAKKGWDDFGASVKALRAAVFVR